jgi:triosephosphate isomerase
MAKSTRKYLIAGNWKMNLNAAEGAELAAEVAALSGQQNTVGVAICPPLPALAAVAKAIEGSSISLGAQNMHYERSGAYTGEVSAEMLRHHFCSYVILGHSERREYFAEDDAFINRKVKAALAANLRPILCVGETLAQREADETMAVVKRQVEGGLADVGKDAIEQVVIAYEPVWAIGTGKTATPEMAQAVHASIRSIVADLYDAGSAAKVRILYGGSMKPENAAELLAQADIDGGLIGGASLKASAFHEIVVAALA